MAAVENIAVPLQQVAKKSSAKPAQYLLDSESTECAASIDRPSLHKSEGVKNNGIRLTNGVGDSEGESLEDGEIVSDSDVEESSRKRTAADLDEPNQVQNKIPKLSDTESSDVNLPLNGDQLVVDTACRVSDSEQLHSDRNMSESENSLLSSINSPDEFTETTEPNPESSERQPSSPKCVQNSESDISNPNSSIPSSECPERDNDSKVDTPQDLPINEANVPQANETEPPEDNSPSSDVQKHTASSPHHPIQSATSPTSPEETVKSPSSPPEGPRSPAIPEEGSKSPDSPKGGKSSDSVHEDTKPSDAAVETNNLAESPQQEDAMSPSDAIQNVPPSEDPEEITPSLLDPVENEKSCNLDTEPAQDVSENSSISADVPTVPNNPTEDIASEKSVAEESNSVENLGGSEVAGSDPNSPLFSEDSNSSSQSGCAKMTFNLAQSKINISESFKGSLKEIISKVSEGDKDSRDSDESSKDKESSQSSTKPDLATAVDNADRLNTGIHFLKAC